VCPIDIFKLPGAGAVSKKPSFPKSKLRGWQFKRLTAQKLRKY